MPIPITYTVVMQMSQFLAAAANVVPFQLKIRALDLISGMIYTRRFGEIDIYGEKAL